MTRIRLASLTTAGVLLSTFALIFVSVSCEELAPEIEGPRLTFVDPPFPDGIPAEYGSLVAAVPHTDGRWISLWFEKPDRTIVGVWVGTRAGTVERVVEIPRK